ncbi:uncharacterized protein C12orf56 homolog [Sapajus apella]|uniref:Uncharacterized protein C12orf56 homolog n=1 Tax=Sapajus apella TaxID=9515 RepID=A0A6J3IKZ2_SAPAP|nr:uncharacterized protein C12orf56 homolog [Sapajus apella]
MRRREAGGFVARGFQRGGGESGGADVPAPLHAARLRAPRMASLLQSGFPARLDVFLRRHLPPEVYDAVRAYERCIVVSNSENHTLKYVVLSDRFIYLTEKPPKSIRRVVALRDVVAIDLVSGAGGQAVYLVNQQQTGSTVSSPIAAFPAWLPLSELLSRCVLGFSAVKEEKNGPAFWRSKEPRSVNESPPRDHQESSTPSKDSTLYPRSDLKKLSLHGQGAFRPLPSPSRRSSQSAAATGKAVSEPSSTTNTKEPQGLPDHNDSISEIPFKCNGNGNEFYLGNSLLDSPSQSNSNLEKKESELHLYVISITSSVFLHLKSSWNNYIIKATLLQDPLYVSEFSPAIRSQKPYSVSNFDVMQVMGKFCDISDSETSDLFYFLVNKLHEYLPESRDKNGLQNQSQRVDELVACIEIIQTLGLMFRETETELSRLNTLAAKKGTLLNLLVILISEPQIPKSCPVFNIQLVADSALVEMSFDAELQKLILEYTDTATALLYEILLVFQQGSLGLGSTKFAISWMMSFLQSCPPIITFVASIVKQVVRGLSASFQLLSPCQAVLLYQQFYILKSCLRHSRTLAEYIRNNYREEFRYFIHMPALKKRLPLCYPITQPTTQLFHEVLKLVE